MSLIAKLYRVWKSATMVNSFSPAQAWYDLEGIPIFLGGIDITDNTLSFPSITGSQTFGFLRFSSGITGSSSTVVVATGTIGLDFFGALNPPTGGTIQTPVDGLDAGVQNDPVNPGTERERLLSHLIFSPVLKSANRTLTVTYTLTISVARTSV